MLKYIKHTMTCHSYLKLLSRFFWFMSSPNVLFRVCLRCLNLASFTILVHREFNSKSDIIYTRIIYRHFIQNNRDFSLTKRGEIKIIECFSMHCDCCQKQAQFPCSTFYTTYGCIQCPQGQTGTVHPNIDEYVGTLDLIIGRAS